MNKFSKRGLNQQPEDANSNEGLLIDKYLEVALLADKHVVSAHGNKTEEFLLLLGSIVRLKPYILYVHFSFYPKRFPTTSLPDDYDVQSNPALRTPALYEHLIITDSLLCPWGKESPAYIFSKLNPLDTDTLF